MANGDFVNSVSGASFTFPAFGRHGAHIKLIDAAAGTANGVWVEASPFYDHGSIDVTISVTATVQIRGSDAATKPANSADGFQIGADITATGGFGIEDMPRWIKAKVSSFGSGQVDVLAALMPIARG